MVDRSLARAFILPQRPGVEMPPSDLRSHGETGMWLEHARIPFPNYPYEWSPPMLHAAAMHTIRLAAEAARAGFLLKDATPYNLMFDGAWPVFLDLLSFRRCDPREALWRPWAQFMRMFGYPLLANRYFGLRLDEVLLPNSDGQQPERMARLCPAWRLPLPPFLGSVTILALLSRGRRDASPEEFRARPARDAAEAGYLRERMFRRANRFLRRLDLPADRGAAGSYLQREHNYRPEEWNSKQRFVDAALEAHRPQRVLDIGSNTGHFSLAAARRGARVVAIDRDPGVAGLLFAAARRESLDVLPLAVDIARPAGACGWNNGECPSFPERARGKFDCVLLLALLHHLLVNDRAPLDSVVDLIAALTTRMAIVEYVDPADAQFQRLMRGREALHSQLTREVFQGEIRRCFTIVESLQVTPSRTVYLLQKAGA
jgi:SAM-dependent methyltransferase